MCANFKPTQNELWVSRTLGATLQQTAHGHEVFPGQASPIAVANASGQVRTTLAKFGLVPGWTKSARDAQKIVRATYNARTETVADKPSYRAAWRKRQFAIALVDEFYEPCWASGQAVRWGIKRIDGEPMGIASLWDEWTDPDSGEVVSSFSMLTVNADGHLVMRQFHRPEDEKRSVVVLEPGAFQSWLGADITQARALITQPIDGLLTADPRPFPRAERAQKRLFR